MLVIVLDVLTLKIDVRLLHIVVDMVFITCIEDCVYEVFMNYHLFVIIWSHKDFSFHMNLYDFDG